MFRLPGVIIEDTEEHKVTEEQLTEIEEWCKAEHGTGKRMNTRLWSFRTEAQRDWFILRWSGNDQS